MKTLYLVLAILGAIVPYVFFLQFFGADQSNGQPDFIAALFANGAAGGFTADLLISSLVFWIFMWTRRSVGPHPLPFVVLNLLIGLSCALPAYLYAAARRDTS